MCSVLLEIETKNTYMIYETKTIIFHMWKWAKLKNFTNSWENWVWSKMCGKHCRLWSKAKRCNKVWYWDSQTCLGQSMHRNACELSRMEAIGQMVERERERVLPKCQPFDVYWWQGEGFGWGPLPFRDALKDERRSKDNALSWVDVENRFSFLIE